MGQKKILVPTKVQKPFWKAGNQVYLYVLVNFHASGSGSAFLNRIQDSQMNADPGFASGSG
jgi:hypothetical protein